MRRQGALQGHDEVWSLVTSRPSPWFQSTSSFRVRRDDHHNLAGAVPAGVFRGDIDGPRSKSVLAPAITSV